MGVHLVILARAGAPLVPARPSLATLRQLLSIGVPMSASGVLSCLAFMCLAKVLTGLDTAFVAALGISHRIEGFVYQTAVGFKVATSSLVGQSIGAGSPVRAQLAAFTALRLVIATMIPIALGMFVFSESLAQIFTSDPVVSGAANSYLRICAASLPLLGMGLHRTSDVDHRRPERHARADGDGHGRCGLRVQGSLAGHRCDTSGEGLGRHSLVPRLQRPEASCRS